jgi:hypothetical protein
MVVVAWTDIQVGGKTIKQVPQRRTAKVRTDGSFLVCGIPQDLSTGVTALRGSDSTASVPVSFARLLSVQSFVLPAFSNDSSRLSGGNSGAVLRGTIFGPDKDPMSGVRVAIEDDGVATMSDAKGAFVLTGARSGTRAVTARKIGFEPIETTVTLSAIEPRDITLQFGNTVKVLDAVRISALRDIGLQRVGFSERKRTGNGKFYTPQDIANRSPLRLNNLLETAPMLRSGQTADGKRYVSGRFNACVRYFVDGFLAIDAGATDLDLLPDSYLSAAELGAVEVYDAAFTPPQYMASHNGMPCETVVIWTKWKIGQR